MITPRFGTCDVIIGGYFFVILGRFNIIFKKIIMGFKQISAETRGVIIFLQNEEKSQRFIANKTGVSRKGVQGVLKRWMQTGDSRCQPRSGRKRKSVTRCDRTLIRISLRNRKLTLKELSRELKESSGVELSAPTVRRRLLENGLRGSKARKKPLLTEKQRKHRLEWERSHVKWHVENWRKVLFGDESTFTLNNHVGNNYVRRRPEEEYRPYCISLTIKHPQSIMVWGCMAASGIGRLKLVSGMMNETNYIDVLKNQMLPSACSLFSDDD